MSAFIRRFTELPSLRTLLEIEAVNIIDIAPQGAFLGIGTGTLLCTGEYEDGPFANGGDASEYFNPGKLPGQSGVGNILEVFSDTDMKRKYGQFGFVYGGVPSQNPCARRHLSEYWNGNGFLKLKNVRSQRLLCARVDTSVGDVTFLPLALISGTNPGPFGLAAGDQLSLTTNIGGPALSTALAAVVATVVGGPFALSGFVGGETISIQIDSAPAILVTFTVLDQTPAQVAARINAALGYTAAVGVGFVTLSGITAGTSGSAVLADVSPGALAAIGLVAGTTAGTGNVANINAVTATELATIINTTVALIAIGAVARALPNGALVVSSTTATVGTISVTAGPIATAAGLLVATTVAAGEHGAGTIPAGTRVEDVLGNQWVTMQTLTIAAGTSTAPNQNPHRVKVRPALDDGTAAIALATTVNVVIDQPTFANFACTNAAPLTAALTEPQMDSAYGNAFDRTLSLTTVTRFANFALSARRSTVVVARGRQNAIDASDNGCFGRKFVTGSALGVTLDQAILDVAQFRSDRVYYTTIGMKTRLDEIGIVGADGGIGFTVDGVVTLRADSALATICCMLAPEENPGQQTALLGPWFGLEDSATDYGLPEYKALKAAGICAPRVDSLSGMFFQSGVTSSLEPGREEIERRNMADYVQDSLAILALPYAKKLPTARQQDGFIGDVESFLSDLRSEAVPDAARIRAYSIDTTSINTPEYVDAGVFGLLVKVKTFSSMKALLIPVEIGASVQITDAA